MKLIFKISISIQNTTTHDSHKSEHEKSSARLNSNPNFWLLLNCHLIFAKGNKICFVLLRCVKMMLLLLKCDKKNQYFLEGIPGGGTLNHYIYFLQ